MFIAKNELRKKIKQLRKEISWNDNVLVKKLQETKFYQEARNIMLFYPLEFEVNLLSVLDDKSKKFYLPRIDGKNLLCCPYNKETALIPSKFNTQEPMTEPVDKNSIDLIIVPALCCDKNHCRLGYGGGFYDRFLQDYKGKTITCLPKELVVDNISAELHDIEIDMIITD